MWDISLYLWDIIMWNESCETYEWVMWDIWMSHVRHMNESCETYEMSHIYVRIYVRCLTSKVRHFTYIYVKSQIYEKIYVRCLRYMRKYVSQIYEKTYVRCHIYVKCLTFTYTRDISYICENICEMSHFSHIYEMSHTSHIYMRHLTYIWDVSHICEMSHFRMCNLTHIHISDVTHMHMCDKIRNRSPPTEDSFAH